MKENTYDTYDIHIYIKYRKYICYTYIYIYKFRLDTYIYFDIKSLLEWDSSPQPQTYDARTLTTELSGQMMRRA